MEQLADYFEAPRWQGGQAVVVDDNAASAHMLADFIGMLGHKAQVIFAESETALAEAVAAAQPDVVFLDLMLGRLDGRVVARALRDSGCDAYLIAVTGWGEPEDAGYSLQLGFDEHWTKPLDTHRVEAFMRERPQRVSSEQAISTAA